MALSNILPGKANSIALSGESVQRVPEPEQRFTHAPCFARAGEPEPNVTSGERLQPPHARPRRRPTRTLADARAIGLSMPEALDLTPEEIASL